MAGTMLPDPLHPAIVHFPIALAVLVPLLAVPGFFLIWLGILPARSWGLVVLLQALLLVGGLVARETGHDQEERVEKVVAERHIEHHEEQADRFVLFVGIALLVCAAGLAPARAGTAGRAAGALATLFVLVAGVYVGHSGGELVYKHGAAAAYATPAPVREDER